MKRTHNTAVKYIVILLAGILMNQIFYTVASSFNLPVWLDTCGTAFAAIALEPVAGIIVGFINNFYLSILHNDMSTIIYFASSAAVAVICGICMRDKEGKVKFKKIGISLLLVFVVTTILSAGLTIIRNGGIPLNNYWENYFYTIAADAGIPGPVSCFFATGVVKVFDVLANAAVVILFYIITPKALKNEIYLEN